MLDVKNVSAGYDEVQVLHNISFSLNKGENLAIVGPNGCGKTTLLRTLAKVIDYKGEILLQGENIQTIKRKELAKKVAFLSQISNVYFDFTVYDTVMMGRYAYQSKKLFANTLPKDKEIVHSVLENLGLLDVAHKDISTLSGGQLQRVFLAKILVQEPDLILLDEPTNHLDLTYQIELIDYLKNWAKENHKSVVGVLHDINLAIRLSNKIAVMEKGEFVSVGDVQEVLRSTVLKEVYKLDIHQYMKESFMVWSNF